MIMNISKAAHCKEIVMNLQPNCTSATLFCTSSQQYCIDQPIELHATQSCAFFCGDDIYQHTHIPHTKYIQVMQVVFM